jgi:glycosyltransferase A (GT-A) superfamily protein (DUF2064 family)
VIVVTPAIACGEIEETLTRHGCSDLVAGVLPQAEGDLGVRMRDTMSDLLGRGAAAVALIGSDVPQITAAHVSAAFDAVTRDCNVLALGPARDGGYYLLAASRVPDVFDDVEWGSVRVLEETQRAAGAHGLVVCLVPTLDDVDTVDDLRRAVSSGNAPRTAAWLDAVLP